MTGKGRILVVDDDPAILDFVSMALSDEGYEVQTAADGRSALEIIERWPPDLILLDMRMPIMDGWEFASAYARRPGHHAPVVVLTAAQDAAGLAREIQAVDYVAKPFALDDLLRVVAAHTQRSRDDGRGPAPGQSGG
jgi:two-component system chemotaxis response regulator CheY